MKENWTYKKLGEVCLFRRGLTYSGKDEVEHSENIVLRSNNVDLATFSLNFDELKYISDDISIPKDKMLKRGALLMCMSNGSKQHLGKVAFIDKDYPYAFGGFMGLLCPIEDEIVPKFLYYYCCSPEYKSFLAHIGNGANINNLRFSQLSDNLIPLPPLSIQQSIVAELDEINNLIQLKKKELEIFDKLAQSIFYEMFGDPVTNEKGWEVKNFGEIGTFLRGKNIQKSDFVKEGMPCIHYGQVHTKFGKMIYSHLTEIPKSVYDKSIIASKGDIIIAITSEDLAGSCKSTAWLGNYDVAVSAHAAVFNHSENPLYIVYYINSSRFKAEKEKYARGFKVMEIKTKDIAKIPITLPPLALQNEFANRIQATEQQKELVKASINKLETLLASRMQYWFD